MNFNLWSRTKAMKFCCSNPKF